MQEITVFFALRFLYKMGKTKEQKYAALFFALRFFSYWTFMRDLIFLVHDWGFMDGNITSPDAL